ncbi:MAG: hypothetical protein JRN20_04490 [Nitrososphaerota archaeon]|nr:hypothetical protein [Nitrososphaerota archaeon]MDG6922409.1 hypothetical protein [Nitrososphaerota archaeon]
MFSTNSVSLVNTPHASSVRRESDHSAHMLSVVWPGVCKISNNVNGNNAPTETIVVS